MREKPRGSNCLSLGVLDLCAVWERSIRSSSSKSITVADTDAPDMPCAPPIPRFPNPDAD